MSQISVNTMHKFFVDFVSRLLSGHRGLCVLLHRATVWWVTFALYFLRDLCGYFFTAKDAKFFAKFTKRRYKEHNAYLLTRCKTETSHFSIQTYRVLR